MGRGPVIIDYPNGLYEPALEAGALPADSVFFTATNTNPNTLLGYGTWLALGSGKVFNTTVYMWKRTV